MLDSKVVISHACSVLDTPLSLVHIVVVKLLSTHCYSTHKTSLIDKTHPPTDGLLHYSRTLKAVDCPCRSDSTPHLAFYIYVLSRQAPLVNKVHAHNCAPLLPIANVAPLFVV